MKPRPAGSTRSRSTRFWTYSQAQAAVPYLTSVLNSLREHKLAWLAHRNLHRQLVDKPGRPDRAALLAQQRADEETRKAHDRYQEAADELRHLDVVLDDAVKGHALLPFLHDDQLAWYVFDLFDTEHLRYWRFQTDPDETRRPLTNRQKGTSSGLAPKA